MLSIPPDPSLDALAVAVLKGLVLDATRRADSGHPGGPMSAADMGYVLFREFLRFDPATRTGSTATGSCSRPGTCPCSSTACSTSRTG